MRDGVELLDGHWVLWGDSTYNFILRPSELWLQLGILLSFFINLSARNDVLDHDLIIESMAMHNACVSLGKNWLVVK